MRTAQWAESQFIEKHRLETRDYSVDWANELATGVSLSGTPTIKVLKYASSAYTDSSSEFTITNEQTSGTKSLWRMGAAGSGQQDSDVVWYVRVSQATDNTQTLVSVHRLYVTEQADPDAP